VVVDVTVGRYFGIATDLSGCAGTGIIKELHDRRRGAVTKTEVNHGAGTENPAVAMRLQLDVLRLAVGYLIGEVLIYLRQERCVPDKLDLIVGVGIAVDVNGLVPGDEKGPAATGLCEDERSRITGMCAVGRLERDLIVDEAYVAAIGR